MEEAVELDLERGVVVGAAASGTADGGGPTAKDSAFANRLNDPRKNYDLAENDGAEYAMEVGVKKKEEEEDTDDEGEVQCRQHASPSQRRQKLHAKKEETDDEDDHKPSASAKVHPPPLRLVQGPPSSLLKLATQVVARNIEKYPPAAMGALSEHHWENVIQARIEYHTVGKRDRHDSALERPQVALDDGRNKTRLPPLSERCLSPIERHPNNAHLSLSKVADELLWKEIVDYHFSGMNRPISLMVPCEVLKERLRQWGNELVELVSPPISAEEFTKISSPTRQEVCVRLGGSSDPEGEGSAYRNHLQMISHQRTFVLRSLLHSLRQSPMDVRLLAATEVGKSARRVVKAMKRLRKQVADEESEKALWGLPVFVTPVSSLVPLPFLCEENKDMNCLELLERMLQDWRDMASESGVDMANSPSKKRKREDTEKPAALATFGRDKKVSAEQHRIDMELLHAAPDWRSLYKSLRKREEITRKAHGDRVRERRENLEKDRPRVGKVVLKRAVNRVRGGMDSGSGNGGLKQPFQGEDDRNMEADTGQRLRGPVGTQERAQHRKERREAILSKSRGQRALHKQHSQSSASSAGSNGKVSKLKRETRVAASLSKSSFGSSVGGFGASVARAGGGKGAKKQRSQSQVHVQLAGGKSMRLPAPSAGLGRSGKAAGVFASLQQKKKAKEHRTNGGKGMSGRKR